MALAANSTFEVRTTGNDTNGGGFVTGASGVDYSQQDNARTGTGTNDSTTDAVANGTTTITSATANFTADIVGNIIYLQGGTGALAAIRRQVTARTNATTITVDASVAAGTGITMNIGGALASHATPGGQLVNGNKIYIKAGTYSISTASTNVPNGCLSVSVGIHIEGYQTTRGDLGTPPLLQAGAISAFTIININSAQQNSVINLAIDCNSQTNSRGVGLGGIAYKLEIMNATNNAITAQASTVTMIVDCYVHGCTTQPAITNVSAMGCVSYNNSVTGFRATGTLSWINCVAYNNNGATVDGFNAAGGLVSIVNCISYNNGRHGFNYSAGTACNIVNCIAENNTGTGFIATQNSLIMKSCAAYNNGTDFDIGSFISKNLNPITGSSSFFTNAAGADFSLNNTAGGGADVREMGFPGILLGIPTTTGYLDIGAFQHQIGGGGGGGTKSYAG